MNNGKQLNQNQIAKKLEVSPPAVMKALPKLENLQLISIDQDKETKRWSIELNADNENTIHLKRADNLKLIYESGLFDSLETAFAGASIILFGSYSRGEDTVTSDIDIAVVGREEKKVDFQKYENLLSRKINVNFYSSFTKINKHLKANIFNGIMLAGGVEL